ncbi:hypothetical protein ABT294_20895 [Nonomuraea sp. NPDC000554]|uniref:hypothetical protein n=1 Tax=Nonomuraea sp. NPDC000554 TaxID=3154259 RepID=UPI00331C4E5C
MASLDLEKISSGWSLAKGDLNLREGQKYVAGAYNAKTHVRMADVTFTKESTKQITTGRILVQDYDGQRPDGVDVLLSATEFSARAQRYC